LAQRGAGPGLIAEGRRRAQAEGPKPKRPALKPVKQAKLGRAEQAQAAAQNSYGAKHMRETDPTADEAGQHPKPPGPG